MGRVGGWLRLTFFFLLDGAHRGEDSTVAIHRNVKKRGGPHASGLRVGVVSYRHNRSRQRIKTANNQIKTPTRKPDAWATQFIPYLTPGPPARSWFLFHLTFHRGMSQNSSMQNKPEIKRVAA